MTVEKSDHPNKIKVDFFQDVVVTVLMYRCTTWTLTERLEKKNRCEPYKHATCCFEQLLGVIPYKITTVWPIISHLTDKQDMLVTDGEVRTNS